MIEGYRVFFVPIFIIVIFGGIFFLYAFHIRRAISKVIEIFRQHHALGIQEAKTLKTELQNIETSLKALKERFQVYYDTIKEKGGDLSNLTL